MGRYPYAVECKKLKERIKELEEQLDNARDVLYGGEKADLIEELKVDKENLRQYASGLENAQNLITVRYKDLEALLEQLIPIAEKADTTDDSEGTTIELAKQALLRI